ncbi:MAG: MerR family DNA-binding transcriptional regulator [Candidatus Asgardarchaeia archaeon]
MIRSGDLAKMFGVSSRTISEWHKTGRLKADLITSGGHRRYSLEKIENILITGVFDEPYGRISCVYGIKHIINSKLYIGSTVDYGQRKKSHISLLKNHNHPNPHLQNAFLKYGENNFSFFIIELVNVNILRLREDFYLNSFRSYDRQIGYNIDKQSHNKKHSSMTKKKISRSLMGHSVSKESRTKMSKAKIGTSFHKGHKHTDEAKKKMSEKLSGVKRGPRSEAVKRKISEANKGRKPSEKTREKMRKSRLKYVQRMKDAFNKRK